MGTLPDDRKRDAAVSRSRRAFLRGVSGSGFVMGAVVLGTGTEAEADLPPEGESRDGYRENAHIRRYYQLSRF